MKGHFWVLPVILFLLVSTCGCRKEADTITAMGSIEKIKPSFSSQGTHMLVGKNAFLALQSKKIDLDHFMNKSVCIVGELLVDHPQSEGPKLIEVIVVYE